MRDVLKNIDSISCLNFKKLLYKQIVKHNFDLYISTIYIFL